MRFILTAILLASCRLEAQDIATTNRDWISEPISSQYVKFRSFTVYPCPSDKTMVATYCESEESWWGHLRVFKHNGNKVEWAAVFPPKYIEERGHYIVSCHWKSLDVLTSPVLELIESTHMGNGALWLLEVSGKELRLLLCIPVRGDYWGREPEFEIPPEGEARFAGNHLKVDYQRAVGEKDVAVVLTGSLLVTDMEGKKLPARGYRQQCTWNNDKRVFEVQPPKATKPAEQPSPGQPTTKPAEKPPAKNQPSTPTSKETRR